MKGRDSMKKIFCLLLCLLIFLPAVSMAIEHPIGCSNCRTEAVDTDGNTTVGIAPPGSTVYVYFVASEVPEDKFFNVDCTIDGDIAQIDYSGEKPFFIMPESHVTVRAKLEDRKAATVDLTEEGTAETDLRMARELIRAYTAGSSQTEYAFDLNNDGKADVTVSCDNSNNKGIVRRESRSDVVMQDVTLSITDPDGEYYNCMYMSCKFKVTRSSTPDPDPDPNPSPNPEPGEKVSLKKLKSVKHTAVSAKKLKITWKKLTGKERKKIQKIQIQVSTDKKFTKIVKKTLLKSTKASWTIPGLKKNTKYWVRIRAYTKSGNVINVSKWIVKSKKTKKK